MTKKPEREVREALDRLDGSTAKAVELLTGASSQDLEALGGFDPEAATENHHSSTCNPSSCPTCHARAARQAYLDAHRELGSEMLGKTREGRIHTLQVIALTFAPGDVRREELLAIAEDLEREGGEPADVTNDLIDRRGIWDAAVWGEEPC